MLTSLFIKSNISLISSLKAQKLVKGGFELGKEAYGLPCKLFSKKRVP